MGRLKEKGKAGAARAYTTRTAAVRKLQISLADFRRLCILKGIFPREPRNRKKANKGSSVPTSFYYAKDIAYLAHEPVLKKLREHKAFAKKLSRALGRGEWSSAKSLEENKPVYRLDHIVKERYPTFIDALRDIDDALCMISLFANLPSTSRLPPEIIENCMRLSAEWQLYIMHSKSLRKVFLSIKGVYYQAEVMDQQITWLVPYQFTQSIPPDVDVRVMLTFIELYQTLLGFVFFKLYTEAGLVYPPPLDDEKDRGAAGIGAYNLQKVVPVRIVPVEGSGENHARVSSKDVHRAIKSIGAFANVETKSTTFQADTHNMAEEDFVPQHTSSETQEISLPTLKTISSLPQSIFTNLFSPYTFFLSRETPRSIFEFLVRSFGGRIGWPASSGSGSPFSEADESITHVIIDRPIVGSPNEMAEDRTRLLRRKLVQPQWVIDCINAGRILLEDPYAQGKTLPPHLSPFGEKEGAYDPLVSASEDVVDESEEEDALEEEEEDKKREVESTTNLEDTSVNLKKMDISNDPEHLRAAELAAETAGVDYRTFEKAVASLPKRKRETPPKPDDDEDMNKMLMSNKQRKLYEKIQHSRRKQDSERASLEARKRTLNKAAKRVGKPK